MFPKTIKSPKKRLLEENVKEMPLSKQIIKLYIMLIAAALERKQRHSTKTCYLADLDWALSQQVYTGNINIKQGGGGGGLIK